MALTNGTRLGHYEVSGSLGKGGMGEVYRARDTKLNREVALKVLPAEVAENADRRRRFELEAQSVAALNHPNIVTIHSVEQADGVHFITMELVEGKTLTELIPPGGIPLSRLFDIAVPLADALATAHSKGITHRDVKPDNVMVTAEGRIKVLDFGLAKLAEPAEADGGEAATETAEGTIVGTVAYMSPEQAAGRAIDIRSDVFSLGVVLYELASGVKPFEGDTRISTITAILRDAPPPLTDARRDLPRHLTRIVNHCLAKEPDRRYQSALDVRNELDELRREIESGELGSESSSSGVTRAPESSEPTARRRWGPISAVGVIAALLVVGAIWLFGRGSPRPTTDTAGSRSSTGPVAVLGFENLSDPADSAQLGRMLVGLITTGLADSGGVEVVSTAKVLTSLKEAGAQAGGFDPTLAAAAARVAGADLMIVGQVIQSDERLLLTAELVDVESGNTLGSMRAEGSGTPDLFSMASEVATEVHEELGVGRLEEGLAIDLAQSLTDSPEAYGLYAAGELALHERQFDVAIEKLQQAVESDPTFALAYYELGMAQFWIGDRGGALRTLHNGLQHTDRLPPRWQTTYQAVIDYEAGNADKAFAALESLIADSPEIPDPYNYLGEIHTHYNKYRDPLRAGQLFSRALELDPTYKVVLYHLSSILLMYDEVDEVRALLARYENDVDSSVIHLRSRLLYHERRFADLLALEQEYPSMSGALVDDDGLFRSSLIRTGQTERAFELSDRLVAERVGYSKGGTLHNRALDRARVGQFRAALDDLEAALPFYDSPVIRSQAAETLITQAQILEILGDRDAAIERVGSARQIAPFDPQSRFHRARLRLAAGQIEAADREIADLELIADNGDSPLHACWLTLARAERHRATGDPAEASRVLNRETPRDCHPITREARELLLARAAEDAGEIEQSLRHFETVARPPWPPAEPTLDYDIPALYDVARLQQRLGRLDDARRHYRELLDHWGDADLPVPIVESAREQLALLDSE